MIEFDKEGRWKCEIVDNDIELCQALSAAIDNHNSYSKAKGLYHRSLVNMETFKFSRCELGLKSKNFPNGLMLNFCPFCGEKVNTLLVADSPERTSA